MGFVLSWDADPRRGKALTFTAGVVSTSFWFLSLLTRRPSYFFGLEKAALMRRRAVCKLMPGTVNDFDAT